MDGHVAGVQTAKQKGISLLVLTKWKKYTTMPHPDSKTFPDIFYKCSILIIQKCFLTVLTPVKNFITGKPDTT